MQPNPASRGDEHYSLKTICRALIRAGLSSKSQAMELLKKEDILQKRLASLIEKNSDDKLGNAAASGHETLIDVIAPMELQRKDKPSQRLDEDAIYRAVAAEWKMPYKKIDPLKLDLNIVTTTIPKSFALKHLVLPIEINAGVLSVATPDPFNIEVMDDITRVCNMRVSFVVSAKTDIIKQIGEFFGFKRSIAEAEVMFTSQTVDLGNLEQYVKLKSAEELISNDQHIVNAVNHLLVYAFEQKASDIHIEPKREVTMVRMRIDGILHTVYKLPRKVHNAIVSRIKTLARMNMAEKRRAQDGRIKTDKGGVEVEIRISTVPVAFGEKCVMRIMDPDILFQDLAGLGFMPEDLEQYNHFIDLPYGILLVCGPTGSGKSTTLYSTLRLMSTSENNIITIEDPIEMIHEDFNQIGVQPAVDITYANILKTILRQDPDIIMVGEMRDIDTARHAVQAALTGHLVLSTLHTNDAPSAVTRLLDLGVPNYMIEATLAGVVAQRLVRRICSYCTESFEIDSADLLSLGLDVGKKGPIKLKRGKGCIKCRQTGYRGRTGIYEVMPYSETLKEMAQGDNLNIDRIRTVARKEGMRTLRESAIQKMLAGITTYQEVLKVTWD